MLSPGGGGGGKDGTLNPTGLVGLIRREQRKTSHALGALKERPCEHKSNGPQARKTALTRNPVLLEPRS